MVIVPRSASSTKLPPSGKEAAGTDDGTGYPRLRGSGIGEVREQGEERTAAYGRQRRRALRKFPRQRRPCPLVHTGTIFSGGPRRPTPI